MTSCCNQSGCCKGVILQTEEVEPAAAPKCRAGKAKVNKLGSIEQIWINCECNKTLRESSDRRAGGGVGPVVAGGEESLVEVGGGGNGANAGWTSSNKMNRYGLTENAHTDDQEVVWAVANGAIGQGWVDKLSTAEIFNWECSDRRAGGGVGSVANGANG